MEKNTNSLTVHILVDRSGSMDSYKQQTVRAVNAFVKALSLASFPASVTLSLFCDGMNTIYEDIPSYELPQLTVGTFNPHGGTALFGCMLRALTALKAKPNRQKALVVITDGEDGNGQRQAQLKAEIQAFQKTGGLVLYLGAEEAGVDANDMGRACGITAGHALSFRMRDVEPAMQKAALAVLQFQGTNKAEAVKV